MTGAVIEGYAIVELMGHRRVAGHVSEVQFGGSTFLRIDIPGEPPLTQLYATSAIYCLTPTDEQTAEAIARLGIPTPVSRWELQSGDDGWDGS